MTANDEISQVVHDTTDGRIEIRRRLGEGGMGDVFLAFDNKLQQLVALKVLRSQQGDTLLRFKQEFRALANVTHQNLVCLYDFVISDTVSFFTMESIDGRSFLDAVQLETLSLGPGGPADNENDDTVEVRQLSRTIVDEGITIPVTVAVDGLHGGVVEAPRVVPTRKANVNFEILRDAARQLATAIIKLHRTGHLHRDIKPSNVLIEKTGRVVVLDFGIITAMGLGYSSLEGDDSISVGTPGYMAPELFLGGSNASTASDWYAFGTILYQSMTGGLPYHGNTASIGMAKQRFDPPQINELCSNAPDDLASLAMSLLRRDPTERPTEENILHRLGLDIDIHHDSPDETLIGREPELALLNSAFNLEGEATPSSVMVRAESGMGKTALVEHFLNSVAGSENVLVLSGRCFERESVPYKALDGVMDSAYHFLQSCKQDSLTALLPEDLPALLRAFPVFKQLDGLESNESMRSESEDTGGHEWKRRALAAAEELFDRIARHKRLIILVDDLQWSDTDSIPILARLIRGAQLPLFLLCTYRAEEEATSPALQALRDAIGGANAFRESTEIVDVPPLTEDSLKSLAKHLLGSSANPTLVQRIAAESGGSPYLVQEIVRYVASIDNLEAGHSLTLASVIGARIDGLSKQALQLLEVVSVAGWRVPQLVAEAASKIDGDKRRTLLELINGRFILSSGRRGRDSLEAFHDKIREVTAGRLSEAATQGIHLALALQLDATAEAEGEYLYPLAQHYSAANNPDWAQRAFETNFKAANRAAGTYAHEQARKFYSQAHRVTQRDPKHYDKIDHGFCVAWARAAAVAGHISEAMSAFERAIELSQTAAEKASAYLGIARLRMGQLNSHAADLAAQKAMDALDTPPPSGSLLGLIASIPLLRKNIRKIMAFRPDDAGAAKDKDQTLTRLRLALYVEYGYISYFNMDTKRMLASQFGSLSYALLLGEADELVVWLTMSSLVTAILGKETWSIASHKKSVELGKDLRDPALSAWNDAFWPIAMHFSGHTVAAAKTSTKVLTTQGHLLENQDFLTVTADLTWNLLMRGYATEAWDWTKSALQRTAAAGDTSLAAQGHTFRCYAGPERAMVGDAESGFEHLKEFAQLLGNMDFNPWHQSQHLAHSLWAMALAGKHGDDFDILATRWDSLNHNTKRIPQQMRQAYIAIGYVRLANLGKVLASDAREYKRATAKAKAALKVLRKTAGHPTISAHLHVLESRLCRIQGKPKSALKKLLEAEERIRKTDNPWIEAQIFSERAAIAQGDNDTEAAGEFLRRAAELAQKHHWKNALAYHLDPVVNSPGNE